MPVTPSESVANAGLPISRSGTSRVSTAYADAAVVGDGAGPERVGDRRDVVERLDLLEHRGDVAPVLVEGGAVRGLEHDERRALGGVGEVVGRPGPSRGRSGCPARRSRR